MLRSLTSQLEVHLHATGVAIAKTRLGLRAEERHFITVANPARAHSAGWEASLIALDTWLETASQNGSRVEFVVSDHFIHYGLIPWSADVQSSNELNALGRAALHTLYGQISEDWEMQVEYGGYGGAGLACAMEQALISTIVHVCDKHALRLRKIQPLFTRTLNHLRKNIGQDGLIAVVERNRCMLASIQNGAWHSARALSVGLGPANALDVLIERELVLQGLDANVPIHVQSVARTDISVASKFPNAVLAEDAQWPVPAPLAAAAARPAEV